MIEREDVVTGKPALGEQPPQNVETAVGEKGLDPCYAIALSDWLDRKYANFLPKVNFLHFDSSPRMEIRIKKRKERKEKLFHGNEPF